MPKQFRPQNPCQSQEEKEKKRGWCAFRIEVALDPKELAENIEVKEFVATAYIRSKFEKLARKARKAQNQWDYERI